MALHDSTNKLFTDFSKIISQDLKTPNLEDVKEALSKGLKNCFSEVCVEVVNCPDLSVEPFNLACKGLGETTAILEVGGPSYLLPKVRWEKVYDFKDIIKVIGMQPCFLIGAGAGPWPFFAKTCGEMVANVFADGKNIKSQTHIAKLKDDGSKNVEIVTLPETDTRFPLLGNFFLSEGVQSKVLKIHCKNRTGVDSFITAIRKSLKTEFQNDVIGLGGAFLMNNGKALQHVIPDFLDIPINSKKEFNKWLQLYDMSAPLVAHSCIF